MFGSNRILQLILLSAVLIAFSACEESSTTTPVDGTQKEFVFSANIEVGVQPSSVFYDNVRDVFHVFCLGVDNNFNNVFEADSGDVKGSWWIISDGTNAVKARDFEDFPAFPNRPAFLPEENIVFMNHGSKIISYDLNKYEILDENVLEVASRGISGTESLLFISKPNEYGTPGSVLVYDTHSKQTLQTIEAGINVQQNLYFPTAENGIGLAVLNEGNWGAGDSELMLGNVPISGAPEFKTFNVGGMGNHIAIHKDKIAVTSNGSHEVYIVDITNKSVSEAICVETGGYDGPRESCFANDSILFVTTYTGDLRRININSAKVEQIMPLSGKGEGLSIHDKYMLVTNSLNASYQAINTITVFELKAVAE